MVADFASEYGIRLATADLTWREFLSLLTGLLFSQTRLWRQFTKDEPDPEGGRP